MSKPYERNPRSITQKRLARLDKTLKRYGDLGGIVHDLNSDQIIGGNQRTLVFGEASQVEIVQQYAEPDAQGTVAHGFIVWRGARYAYRQVRWDAATCAEANLAANLGAGSWDADILANQWGDGELADWFDGDLLREWGRDFGMLTNMIEARKETPPPDPGADVESPDEFREYGEDIQTDHVCPKCGYRWSGKVNLDAA